MVCFVIWSGYRRTQGVITLQEILIVEFSLFLSRHYVFFFSHPTKILDMQMKQLYNTAPCLSEELSESSD